MVAPIGVRVADNRLGGLQPVQNRTARVPRFIPAVALILLALTLAVSLAAAVPRRSYYQLAVILNDSHAPDVDFTFWLGSPYPNNASYSDTMAATISITAVFGRDRPRCLRDPTRASRGTLPDARQRHVDPALVPYAGDGPRQRHHERDANRAPRVRPRLVRRPEWDARATPVRSTPGPHAPGPAHGPRRRDRGPVPE